MKDKPSTHYGARCIIDEIYELRANIRKFDDIDIYKQLERIAANPCCNQCILRRTKRQIKYGRAKTNRNK